MPEEMPGSTGSDKDYCTTRGILFEDDLYQREFLKVTGESGRKYSVTESINGWASLLRTIETGYNGWPMELEDALATVREPVDHLLLDPALNSFAEHRKFIRAIGQLDTRFMELTFEAPMHPEDFPWYERRVLLQAGPQYIDLLPEHLKKKVELIG